ncbi:MAG: hypothetical protein JJU00_07430 [Opitutales bacterium]|nr:hypothetical protein [Opitutales bacterium]
MKRFFLILSSALLLGAGLALSGCRTIADEDPDKQEIPWSQPAPWEGTVPGMPGHGRR